MCKTLAKSEGDAHMEWNDDIPVSDIRDIKPATWAAVVLVSLILWALIIGAGVGGWRLLLALFGG